jgi:hypothetical protein
MRHIKLHAFSIWIAKNCDERICCSCESDKISRLIFHLVIQELNSRITNIIIYTDTLSYKFLFRDLWKFTRKIFVCISYTDCALIHNRYQEVIPFERIQFFVDSNKILASVFLRLYCRIRRPCINWKRKPETTIDIALIDDCHVKDRINIIIAGIKSIRCEWIKCFSF